MIIKQIYSIFLYCFAFLFFCFTGFFFLLVGSFLFPKTIYSSARLVSKGMFYCFRIKYEIHGKFPRGGPYIIMHNHSSFLDLFFLPMVIPGKYTGIVAQKNFKIPLLGLMLKRLGAIPVSRANRRAAIQSVEFAQKIITRGFHVCIFPEGTRTISGKIGAFKKGGFHMAINTQTKILPVVVSGLFEIKPKTRWWLSPGLATLTFKDPIDVHNKTVDQLIYEVRKIYL